MCRRFAQLPLFDKAQSPWPELADDLSQMSANNNLAPTQRAAVVMGDGDKLQLTKLRWGLIPPWAKDLGGSYSTINARIETLSTKPAFRAAWKASRRCLIPMAGYYEWPESGRTKDAYFVHRADRQQLYAAALWEPCHPLQDPAEAGSCAIITHQALAGAVELHDRMPVLLDPASARRWLTASSVEAMMMLIAAEIPALEVNPVSGDGNIARNLGMHGTLEAEEQASEDQVSVA
jgi:putative SOS response-associated peptidase YedK